MKILIGILKSKENEFKEMAENKRAKVDKRNNLDSLYMDPFFHYFQTLVI
jgi:hypothetical protein